MTENQKVVWEQKGLYPIESEVFTVMYGFKDDNIIVDAGKAGRISMKLKEIPAFIEELLEIKEHYEGVKYA